MENQNYITPHEIMNYLKEKKTNAYRFCRIAKIGKQYISAVVNERQKMKLSTWQKHVAKYEGAEQ